MSNFIEVKCLLATNDPVEYEISSMEYPIPESILGNLLDDNIEPDVKWIIQSAIVNLEEVELAYVYCPGVTQLDFKSTNGIKVLTSYDEFKKEMLTS